MAWIKCRKCKRRISDKVKKCPRCGTRVNDISTTNWWTSSKSVVFILIQLLLIWLVLSVGNEVLYSGEKKDLIIIFSAVGLLLISAYINKKMILNKTNKYYYIVGVIITICSIGIGIIYGYKGFNALRYDNSIELVNLVDKYSLKKAKNLKKQVDKLFEIDDGVSVRNVKIENFYKDGEEYILYLKDFYNNYSLKFYVLMDNDHINDVYWLFGDDKLYLVKDKKRCVDFSYYYAMYIVDTLMGDDITGLARIEDDVEKIIKKKYDNYANTMVSYDTFVYDRKDNIFKYNCVAQIMDYYADIDEDNFTIVFEKLAKPKSKKIWYYGDASFDYVDWNIKY